MSEIKYILSLSPDEITAIQTAVNNYLTGILRSNSDTMNTNIVVVNSIIRKIKAALNNKEII